MSGMRDGAEVFNDFLKKVLTTKDDDWSSDPQVLLFSHIDKDVHMVMIN